MSGKDAAAELLTRAGLLVVEYWPVEEATPPYVAWRHVGAGTCAG
ncbi:MULTISPECIES: hypothetical protein [Streptomyces]|nr:hypothetical protein [Streptomyces sp. KS_5]SEE27697.1 hypothetical protein SAMN05428938_7686 [Streptomyces sp. KS_5]